MAAEQVVISGAGLDRTVTTHDASGLGDWEPTVSASANEGQIVYGPVGSSGSAFWAAMKVSGTVRWVQLK